MSTSTQSPPLEGTNRTISLPDQIAAEGMGPSITIPAAKATGDITSHHWVERSKQPFVGNELCTFERPKPITPLIPTGKERRRLSKLN